MFTKRQIADYVKLFTIAILLYTAIVVLAILFLAVLFSTFPVHAQENVFPSTIAYKLSNEDYVSLVRGTGVFYYVVIVPVTGIAYEPTTIFEGVENTLMLLGYNHDRAYLVQQFLYRMVGM